MRIQINGVGGRPVTVEAPDGMSPQDAQRRYDTYVAQRAQSQELEQRVREYDPRKVALESSYEQAGSLDQAGIGFANSLLSTYEGAKQLAGLEGPETAERLRVARDTPTTAPGVVGNIVGEIAQVAAPLGAALRVPRLARAPMMTEGAISTAQGALQGTTGDSPMTERLQRAGLGAAGTLLGFAPGGVRPTPEAGGIIARARQEGVPMRLTPGQQGGRAWGVIEQGMEGTPILGSAVRAHNRRGLEDWNRLMLNEVSPAGGVENFGQAGLREVNEQFRRGYDEVIEQAPEQLRMTPGVAMKLADDVQEYVSRLRPESRDEYLGAVQRLRDDLAQENIPREAWKMTKGEFDDLAQGAFRRGDVMLGRAYGALSETMTDAVTEHLPHTTRMALATLDDQYGKFLPVVRAHSYKSTAQDDVMTPETLMGSIRAEDQSLRKKGFALGDQPMQDVAAQGVESLGRRIPQMGPGTAEKVLTGGGIVGALLEPTAAVGLGGGAGLAAGLTYPLAPLMRGQNLLQRAYRNADSGILPPGWRSQLGEAPLEPLLGPSGR